ncbi:MAG: ParB N-terminal domain-containing protein [Acidobacteria bacterium]|nr:ParB N-terminal domain-containing protein [Acidobacteriota bacterium]
MARRIEMWPIDRLVPYARNPRTHSEEQVVQIAASIAEFGFTSPILVDTNAGIIAGHGRLLAARKLGLTEVPVIVLDHLSDTQKRAYVLADNKLATNAGWDEELLGAELAALEKDGFDLGLTGFSDAELEALLTEEREPGEGSDEPDEEIPEAPAVAVTQPGDLWLIGPHRLLCGDCRDREAVLRLFEGIKANVVVTSPPYASQREYDPASGFRPVAPETTSLGTAPSNPPKLPAFGACRSANSQSVGRHRVKAAWQAGRETITAEVRSGTLEDARWHSFSANKTNGLRRTNDDKQRAVKGALQHPRGAELSDREIARHVGVDHVTVSRWREKLCLSGEIHQIDSRTVTRSGITFQQDTTGINHRPQTQARRPHTPTTKTTPASARDPEMWALVKAIKDIVACQVQARDFASWLARQAEATQLIPILENANATISEILSEVRRSTVSA